MDDYKDMIYLPRPVSKKHIPMSREMRAAQFSPFAALTGYSDSIEETARLTDAKRILTDEEKEILNEKLNIIDSIIASSPQVEITYFLPDERKEGGKYLTYTGKIKKIDTFLREVITDDLTSIPVDSIYKIEGDIFNSFNMDI